VANGASPDVSRFDFGSADRASLGRKRCCAGTDDARRTGITPPNPLRLN
jgi:hypothetical protein